MPRVLNSVLTGESSLQIGQGPDRTTQGAINVVSQRSARQMNIVEPSGAKKSPSNAEIKNATQKASAKRFDPFE